MSDNNHNRRTVLKTIGASGALITYGSSNAIAQERHSEFEDSMSAGVDHDLEVINEADKSIQLSLEVGNRRSMESSQEMEVDLGENLENTKNEYIWRLGDLGVSGGDVQVVVETENGRSRNAVVPFPETSQRSHESISILVTERKILIGRLQV